MNTKLLLILSVLLVVVISVKFASCSKTDKIDYKQIFETNDISNAGDKLMKIIREIKYSPQEWQLEEWCKKTLNAGPLYVKLHLDDLLLKTAGIKVRAINLNTDWKKLAGDVYNILGEWVKKGNHLKRIKAVQNIQNYSEFPDTLRKTAFVLEKLYSNLISACELEEKLIEKVEFFDAVKNSISLENEHFKKFQIIALMFYSIADAAYTGYLDRNKIAKSKFEDIVFQAIDKLGRIANNPSVVLDPINGDVIDFTRKEHGFISKFRFRKEALSWQSELDLKK